MITRILWVPDCEGFRLSKEFPTFDELVKFSNKMAVCFDEKRKEKEHREIISNIHGISLGRENSALDEVRDLKKQIQAIHDAMIQQVAASQPRGLPPPWQGTPTNLSLIHI